MIFRLDGRLFERGSTRQEDVVVTVDRGGDGQIRDGATGAFRQEFLWRDAKVSDRIGDTPRKITLPDGRVFETSDNGAVDAIERTFEQGGIVRLVHILERHKRYIAVLLVATVAISYATVRYGIPAFAHVVADRLPASSLEQASTEVLAIFDNGYFTETGLDSERQTHIQSLFDKVVRASGAHAPCCRLLFRKSEAMGANAMALPDGTVILLDRMVKLASSDAALAGVLAHEVGHVEERHSLRQIIQASTLSIGVTVMLGDLSQMSELLISAPLLFAQLQYSRAFEESADSFALRTLQVLDMDTAPTGDLFAELARTCKADGNCGNGWLSTHPNLADRAERFRTSRHP